MVHRRHLSIPQHLTTQGAKTTTPENGRLRSDMLLGIVVFGLMHVCKCLRVYVFVRVRMRVCMHVLNFYLLGCYSIRCSSVVRNFSLICTIVM